jgi:hypothetical protein|tara:strand:+ start:3307 stop:3537 length:231 start_codon:yes stop_codon:yes gene_type:complete
MSKRVKKILLFEEYSKLSEGIESKIRQYIKQNKRELDALADGDEWETIYKGLYTEFDELETSKKGKELRQTFDFIF